MIGLGRMGGNMVIRLQRKGHHAVAFDMSPEAVARAESEGATGAHRLEELVEKIVERPRVVWVMVPAGDPTSQTIRRLSELCEPGDIVIDGGNTNWKTALEDAAVLKQRGMYYLDAGTSGGIWGLVNGYCLMVGGPEGPYRHCEPIFKALAPEEGGLVHTGPEGSGHFVKMVHNGVEYALMQAYAEGFHIMRASSAFPGMDMHDIAVAAHLPLLYVRAQDSELAIKTAAALAAFDPSRAPLVERFVSDIGARRRRSWVARNSLLPCASPRPPSGPTPA